MMTSATADGASFLDERGLAADVGEDGVHEQYTLEPGSRFTGLGSNASSSTGATESLMSWQSTITDCINGRF
jgi:hypothetical protein